MARTSRSLALGREVSRLAAVTGSDADIGRATDMMTRIETRIAGLKATAFAALAVKLRIAADQLLLDDDGDWRTSDQMNLLSALADVERMAKKGEGMTSSAAGTGATAAVLFAWLSVK